MRKLEPRHIEECKRMRERGDSWRAIGRAFNVSEDTAQRAVDPIHHQRLLERDRLRKKGYKKPPPPSKLDLAPPPVEDGRVWRLDDYGIVAVTRARVRWGGNNQAYEYPMSLPYLKFMRAA